MKISRKKSFLNFWVEPPSQSNHSRIVLLQAHSHDVGTTPASFLFVFVLFTFQFKRQIYNFELYQLKKSVDVIVWIWTRGPQDGRRWRLHWAMGAAQASCGFFFWFQFRQTLIIISCNKSDPNFHANLFLPEISYSVACTWQTKRRNKLLFASVAKFVEI